MVSRECDYAFRVIRALSAMQRVSLVHICDREHIPQAYAYKIMKKLEKADLVRVFRGAKGGYELCCDLDKKSFYDVYHAIEGELLLNECQEPGNNCPHRNGQMPCKAHLALGKMQEEFIQIMKEHPLRSVI